MTKAPRPGGVKTRLVPPLSAVEAAQLQSCFLRDVARMVSEISSAGRACAYAAITPPGAEGDFESLLPETFSLLPQRGKSLSERLVHVAQDLFTGGHRSVIFLNADSPTLPQEFVGEAISALGRAGDRIVLGPADDGGYYLVGLKRPHGALFEGIAWSTGKVLEQTIERARKIGLEVRLLPTWYDVDDPPMLRRLCSELFGAPWARALTRVPHPARCTRGFLKRFLLAGGARRLKWEFPASHLSAPGHR